MNIKTLEQRKERKAKSQEKIEIFLADDHVGVRDSLAEYLNDREEFFVVGKTSVGSDILPQVLKLNPDIVLMDINMPQEDGICVTNQLREKAPESKVIIFSAYGDDSYKIRAFLAGAWDYVEKSESLEKTVETILQVHKQNGNSLNQVIRRRLIHATSTLSEECLAHNLTMCEIQVLETLKDGKGFKRAAEILKISGKTLEGCLTRINSKLDVKNLREAIFYAVRKNIISIN